MIKSKRYMFIPSENLIGILIRTFLLGLKCVLDENIFPVFFFKDFICLLRIHFHKYLNSRFQVQQPKTVVQMNSSTLIYIKIRLRVFDKNSRWLHGSFVKEKLLTTLWIFLYILCKFYVVELKFLLYRQSPSTFLKFTFTNSITTLLLYQMWTDLLMKKI